MASKKSSSRSSSEYLASERCSAWPSTAWSRSTRRRARHTACSRSASSWPRMARLRWAFPAQGSRHALVTRGPRPHTSPEGAGEGFWVHPALHWQVQDERPSVDGRPRKSLPRRVPQIRASPGRRGVQPAGWRPHRQPRGGTAGPAPHPASCAPLAPAAVARPGARGRPAGAPGARARPLGAGEGREPRSGPPRRTARGAGHSQGPPQRATAAW